MLHHVNFQQVVLVAKAPPVQLLLASAELFQVTHRVALVTVALVAHFQVALVADLVAVEAEAVTPAVVAKYRLSTFLNT
jgi:hypothetical protein